LIAGVTAACLRLAPLGWRQLLLDATGGQLDISTANLNSELTRPLSQIDRNVPGFGDFDLAATRAIEAGSPDRSLLYHAFASSAPATDGWKLTARNWTGSMPTCPHIAWFRCRTSSQK
jgi:hypothetical protein